VLGYSCAGRGLGMSWAGLKMCWAGHGHGMSCAWVNWAWAGHVQWLGIGGACAGWCMAWAWVGLCLGWAWAWLFYVLDWALPGLGRASSGHVYVLGMFWTAHGRGWGGGGRMWWAGYFMGWAGHGFEHGLRMFLGWAYTGPGGAKGVCTAIIMGMTRRVYTTTSMNVTRGGITICI
jgi:hypothetical protein